MYVRIGCVRGGCERERESKGSAAFVFQIRLMDLAQIKSSRGEGCALRADWGESMWKNVCVYTGNTACCSS